MDLQQFHTLQAADDLENQSAVWSGAPALAASTVAMTNTSGKSVAVYVSSGTVTVIKHNGVTTGLITGRFVLRNKETIAVTYSVAPTLVWMFV